MGVLSGEDSDAWQELARLYPLALKQSKELDRLMELFESGRDQSVAMQQNLQSLSRAFTQRVDNIDALLHGGGKCSGTPGFKVTSTRKSAPKPQFNLWARRLNTLQQSAASFRETLNRIMNQLYKTREEDLRIQELCGRSQSTWLSRRREAVDRMDAVSSMQRERASLHESSGILDQALEQGCAVITNLAGQNTLLKAAHQKALEFRSSLGLSTSLIGVIERRHFGDKVLAYGCMVFTVIIFGLSFYFWKHRPTTHDGHTIL